MQVPHRPGPLHQTNKSHKGGRHNRKTSATAEIKSKSLSVIGTRRADRLNHAQQNRSLKRERTVESKRKLGVDSQPPLIVAVLNVHTNSCSTFFDAIKTYGDKTVISSSDLGARSLHVNLPKMKMRFKLIALDSANFDETIDVVKSLDLLILLHDPKNVEYEDDENIEFLLRAIHLYCLPSIMNVVFEPLDGGDNASRQLFSDAKRFLKSMLKDQRVHSIQKPHDLIQMFHMVGSCKRSNSIFKQTRPSLVTDKSELRDNSLTLSGFVRNKTLSANSLVHVVGHGDFQIAKIEVLADPYPLRSQSREGHEVIHTLFPDAMKQETLEQENELDPMEGEQTWPTSEELALAAERQNTKKIIKKLPPGTSAYQGAWIPEEEEVDDSGEDDSIDEDGDARMEVAERSQSSESGSDSDREEEDDMELDDRASQIQDSESMGVDDYDKKFTNEKEMKVLEKIKEARMSELFPDELDTPMDQPARLRFARYRGLKSFRTSAWDPQENLPPDYSRIFQFQNFQLTKKRVLNEANHEGADPGQYVRIYLANVPGIIASKVLKQQISPIIIGLLKYERKMTVMNMLIKRLPDSNTKNPIKSKEELIFYCGYRRFRARPIFTQHSVSSKHKYERFFRDDVAMVATMYAPIVFPPAPILVFRQDGRGNKELVASGSVLDSNPNRIVVKRIRLSGHPFKIQSKTAVVRFMFFNSEDVDYFKPVELITKYKRRGHITESLGTHGHMKCTFDKKIRSDDCVFMNLYKRCFPKWTYIPIYY